MEVNNSHFYSEWTIFRAVKDIFFYFIPRFFIVDSKCFVGPKVMPQNTLYNLCDKMQYTEPTVGEKMPEKHHFSRLLNSLTGVKGLNPENKTSSTPNNCQLPNYSFLRPKNDEFSMYDKIVKPEKNVDVCQPEIDLNFLVQIRYGVKISAENAPKSCENSPAKTSANLSKNIELRQKDKEIADPSLEINGISKVCDKVWKKGNNRRAKSRAAILREKKRTRCNNRRSRKANRSNLVKSDVNIVAEEENVQVVAKGDDQVPEVPELQFGVDFQWSFVSETEEEDLPFVSQCNSNSVTYIIDAPESLTICLEDDWDCVDDDWDCVDNEDDNDDVWASFQQCGLQAAGLFLGNFVCQDATDGKAMSEESEEELNCRIRIADANARWERGLDDEALMDLCSETKKVHFAPDLVQVHSLTAEDDEDSRKGPWEEYARDRERFTKKIDDLDAIISPILRRKHRAKVYNKLYR